MIKIASWRVKNTYWQPKVFPTMFDTKFLKYFRLFREFSRNVHVKNYVYKQKCFLVNRILKPSQIIICCISLFGTHLESKLLLTQTKMCKIALLLVWVSALPSMILMVFCLLALLALEVFSCWSSNGGYGCWFWLLISFVEFIRTNFVFSCAALLLWNLDYICSSFETFFHIYGFVLWPLSFVGANRISANTNSKLMMYIVVVVMMTYVNRQNPIEL